jgi:hypothetical protein
MSYISPGEAWLRFATWLLVGLGSLGGLIYLVHLYLDTL